MSDKPPEQSIFLTALELATPAEREAYLRGACGSNEVLRAAVAELLAAHERAGNILDAPPVAAGGTVARDNAGVGSLEQPGTVIGPYKLLQQIGEGGMGTVFMAQQTQPVQRKVALKVIKPGMDSRQVIARFEAERQALALMDHPNIAKVLDAGATPAGRPYFVMELVKGMPITRYCDEHHLTPRQRLDLFLPVCQAVQHAHQKGIIHRDLKPSNVLVALYDGQPVPRVIDFGVAKAAGQSLTDKTLVTGFGVIVGTLEYMSPEQAELNNQDIDTRSDIYSLGVLLYELLTGSPPFSRKDLEKAGMLEMLRVIREQEPAKPSTKLSTAEGLPTLAANRGTEPAKLARLVRGELDWIVMKALEKDRSRRYETANGFAMDLQRYLADEPVLACPPSVGYRLRKFARRNKVALAIAGLVLGFTALLGGGVGWAIHERSARVSRTAARVEEALAESAERYRQRKLPDALAAVRRAQALLDAGDVSAELRERVGRRRRDLEFAFHAEEADLQRSGAMMGTGWDSRAATRFFGKAFRDHGIDVETLPTAEAARRVGASLIRDHLIGALDQWASYAIVAPELKDRLHAVANAADDDPWRQRLRAGARTDREALRQLAAAPDVDGQSPARLQLLAQYLGNQGDYETAVRLMLRAQRRYPGDFWINFRLGYCLGRILPFRQNEALCYMTAAVALRPESPGARVMLGMFLRSRSVDEAAAAYQEAIRLQPTYAEAHQLLGRLRMVEGKDPAGALASFTRAIELSPGSARGWTLRSAAYRMLGEPAKALADANAAVAAEPKEPTAWYFRAEVFRALGERDKAIADYSQAIALQPDYVLARTRRQELYAEANNNAKINREPKK